MLHDHWDSGKFLSEGKHNVSVAEYKTFKYNSGTRGVEFVLKTQRGSSIKTSFCLHEKALWKLANFAKACGLTKEEAASYDENDPNSHRILLHRHLTITVENGPTGYAEVVACNPLEQEEETDLRVVGGTQTVQTEARILTEEREEDDDDIPF